MNVFLADQGSEFGTWSDKTSRLLYHDCMTVLLSPIKVRGPVVDLGGANGLSRQWFPGAVTVDIDPSKNPDVLDDVTTFANTSETVFMRYLLHYLSDDAARRMFANLWASPARQVIVVQFVNDDIKAKLRNSVGEAKVFRNEAQLCELFPPWVIKNRTAIDHEVDPEFYRNRLGHPNPTPHRETILGLELVKP